MKTDFGFLPNLSDEDKLLATNVVDWAESAQSRFKLKYTHFLNEKQCDIAVSVLNSIGHSSFMLYGGYENAKRRMLCVYNEYDEPDAAGFPFTAFTVRFPKNFELSHRDFLGALMSLNIKRESVGDILINNGVCVMFVEDSVARVVSGELTKVGRVGVDISEGCEALSSMDLSDKFISISGTVASMRLDCVLALALNMSRSKITPLIASGKVAVNNFERMACDIVLKENDVFSVKGYGKFLLSEIGGKSRKDRIFLRISKYI